MVIPTSTPALPPTRQKPRPLAMAAFGMTALVALLHAWFFVLEAFLWKTPLGMATFGMTPAEAAATAVLAMNQGAYNGLLAAGLAWTLLRRQAIGIATLRTFLLVAIVVAGIVGGFTAKTSILIVQALPAAVALGLDICSRKGAARGASTGEPRLA